MSRSEKDLGVGWHISQQGYIDLTQNDSVKDQKILYQNALNSDLKDIGKPVLNSEITKSKIAELVLQIHKIRNIAAPKSNEDSQVAPRMLKLTLTDGYSFCQGIECESIPELNVDRVPPGSKVLLKNANIRSGYILLNPSCCIYLGGKVPTLYEKWEVSRSLLKTTRKRSSNTDGPPPWVDFGFKVISATDDNFKSLNNKSKTEIKHDSEFDAQRKDAIAEAASGVKKTFGGGSKKFADTYQAPEYKKQFNSRERAPRDKKRNDLSEKNVDKAQAKPPEKVSLFHFLEDKLSSNDTRTVILNESECKNSKVSTNYPSSSSNQSLERDWGSRSENVKPSARVNQQQHYYSAKKTENISSANRNKPPETNPPSQCSSSVDALANSVGKMSINSQFASRSLKQHLNLSKFKNDGGVSVPNSVNWKIGESCLAKYWEDGKFYNATITDITDNTLVVLFTDYGNVEEVLKSDCKQHQSFNKPYRHNQRYYTRRYPPGKGEQRKHSDRPV